MEERNWTNEAQYRARKGRSKKPRRGAADITEKGDQCFSFLCRGVRCISACRRRTGEWEGNYCAHTMAIAQNNVTPTSRHHQTPLRKSMSQRTEKKENTREGRTKRLRLEGNKNKEEQAQVLCAIKANRNTELARFACRSLFIATKPFFASAQSRS